MFDFHQAFNIDVIVDEWLRVLSKSVFLRQQSLLYIKWKVLAILTSWKMSGYVFCQNLPVLPSSRCNKSD
uniref:Uncharacterized protein n=1 Tax=Lepeophtheirus salmonis TaxID=72036 RepID=A0A0K2SZ09_LEPSM